MVSNLNFVNVKKQENKFICNETYGGIAMFYNNRMLTYNLEVSSLKIDNFKDKIVKRVDIDNNKIKAIEEAIKRNEYQCPKIVLNIRNISNPNFAYSKRNKRLDIMTNHTDIGNGTFVDIISGFEEIIAISNVYPNSTIVNKKIDVEIYNLSTEEIKQMTL